MDMDELTKRLALATRMMQCKAAKSKKAGALCLSSSEAWQVQSALNNALLHVTERDYDCLQATIREIIDG